MTPQRWQRVKSVLDRALRQPAAERAAFLAAACPGDAALREEVASLLAAHDDATRFLGARDALPPGLLEEDSLEAGAAVGPYRLTGLLGQGGMGTVYRAVRDDAQYEREVALKVIRPGLPAAGGQRRFWTERQILASLEHPHIARLYGGGLTADGRPYFAMERVDGTPLDRYCHEARLSVGQRLRLFEKVARAVAYAHRQSVVHRDLKPSNILVTASGTPKLLDFGVAKLLGAREATRTTGPLPLTLAYAAPEQVRSGPATPATDVYALGVVLYELLTGQRPYSFEGHAPSHVERVICETQPEHPSVAAARAAAEGGAASSLPAPSRLKRRLQGDLDRIILKALRKEPARRYATAAELADDLRRHRTGRPVQARPATLRYRAGKFVRRHRWGVATAALLALLLVGYAATVTVQSRRLAAERDRAQIEAQKAEQVSAFLVGLFEQSDPHMEAGRRDMTVREVMDRGAERAKQLRGQPLVQAQLLGTIGSVYTRLGFYGQAEGPLRAALSTRMAHAGTPPHARAESMTDLGYMLFRQSRFEEAERLYRRALALLEQEYGPGDPYLRRPLNDLALLLDERGQPAVAERYYRRALAVARATGDSATTIVHNLANALQAQDRFDEALTLHRQAVAQWRQEHGGGPHPELANAVARMAFTHQRRGDLAVAERLHRQALAMRRQLFSPHHPHIASSLVRLAWVLAATGQAQEAEKHALEGRAILERVLPEGHWQTTAAGGVLGLSYVRQGRFAEGEPLLRESHRVFERAFGRGDWRTRSTRAALAQTYQAWGKPREAAAWRDSLRTPTPPGATASSSSH